MLSESFFNILQDPRLTATYLVIHALDECTKDLPKLLIFIAQALSISSRVKWLISSRNWPSIEAHIERAGSNTKLCVELNQDSISAAVNSYIQVKVQKLTEEKKYDDIVRDTVLQYLSTNANDTFLWVALVCQSLEGIPVRETIAKLSTFPPGLEALTRLLDEQNQAAKMATSTLSG